MKLVERGIGLTIDIAENSVSVIVIEKTELRITLVEELYAQMLGKEGNWILIDKENTFDLGKKVELIIEPFSLELNNKKVKAKLYQDIKEIAQAEYSLQGTELNANICNYIEQLLEKIPYPLTYKSEWDIINILKLYEVELSEDNDSLSEKLFNYIKLVNQVCGIGIFIFINIKQYLTVIQIIELYKIAKYYKIQLVLIEFNLVDKKLDCEDMYVIDKDGCIITY